MDARKFEEQLERQNEQLEAAMKTLSEMGDVQLALPEEVLRSIDEACAARAPQARPSHASVLNGVRA